MAQNSKSNTVCMGIRFPKETIDKIDELKGYHSRNRYILKMVEEYLTAQESKTKK